MKLSSFLKHDQFVDDTASDLLRLTPSFEEARHQVYVDAIEAALTRTDRTAIKNIALTGSYGVGKSSILQKVAAKHERCLVHVSLSTLGIPDEEGDPVSSTVRTTCKTNRIKKEIVKQLLYREDPDRTPVSRFRRIGRFKNRRGLGLAALAALLLTVAFYLESLSKLSEGATGGNLVSVPGVRIRPSPLHPAFPIGVVMKGTLSGLTKTDPCPQVRHRAHLLLAVIASASLAAADHLMVEALEASPMDYGYPVATWSLTDLGDLPRRRRGVALGTATLSRHLKKRGYVYRRPRHDLRHRQDARAVASAKHTLRTLQKRGLINLDTASSPWMNAVSIPIPNWQRCGNDAASRVASPPPEPTNGSPSSAASITNPVRSAR